MPGGQIFFEVPGYPGYVFDPVASNASGRKVFRPNPKLSIEKQKEEEEKLKKQQEQQEFLQSPAGQLLPVAAGTGGLILAHEIMKPAASAIQVLGNGTVLMSDGTIQAAANAVPGISGAATSSLSNAAASGGLEAPNVIGASRVPGNVPVTDGGFFSFPETMPIENGLTLGNALSGAAILKGGYDAIQGLQGGKGVRGGLTTAGAGVGNLIGGPLGGAIGAGFGNLMGYGLQGSGLKNHLALAATMPPLEIARLLGFDVIHETTRQRAQRHTEELGKESDDPTYQGYLSTMREQYNAAPPDPTKPYHGGQYATWDEYKAAGLDSNDLTGVYGNIKTFGPEWANLTQAQRVAVTQGLIDADLYQSKKGEVEITDAAKAKEIKDNVLKGFNVGANTEAQAQAAAQGAVTVPVRSKTRSPGIGLDGRPIVY